MRKYKTGHGIPNSQDHSEVKRSDPTTFQNQEKQENQVLRTTTRVLSLPEQSQGDPSAASSERSEIKGHKDSKRSLCTDGLSKLGNNKKIAAATPNLRGFMRLVLTKWNQLMSTL